MIRSSLTPALLVTVVGMLGFIWYDRDTQCISGTPTLSASVQNYINSKIANLVQTNASAIKAGKSLNEILARISLLDRVSYSAAESYSNFNLLKRTLPEEIFEFDQTPILNSERIERSLEIQDLITSKVRRFCRESK